MCLQRHILPYNPSPYVALALRLHRLVANDVNPWAFFKLVDKASYRLGLWLQFLFPKMRYLYLTRLVSSAGTLFFKFLSICALRTVTTL
jgi:hypothetical protein